MQVISASRRTDIPAYYGDWLMNRIKEGSVQYKNPFNQAVYNVSLRREEVLAFVFWSKNYEPFMDYLSQIDQIYPFYMHFSITAVDKSLEINVPPVDKAIEVFKILSERYNPSRMIWRYDPIVLTNTMPIDYYAQEFDKISSQLEGYTQRCYFSFVQRYYKKVQRQFTSIERNHGILFDDPTMNQQKELLDIMKGLSSKRGITLYTCCQDQFVDFDIKKGICIDRELIQRINPDKSFDLKKNPTRKDCGCFKSIDIGAYDTCPQGCLYCYANISPQKSLLYYKNHQINSVSLGYSGIQSRGVSKS